MNKTHLIALAALVFAAPAYAQEEIASLQVEAGTIMTSEGGEFQTATTGETVAAGERVMVAENSSVLVRYGRDCIIRFAVPGVHVVPSSCVPGVAGAMSSGTVATGGTFAGSGAAIGIVAGVVALSAVAMESAGDGDPVPPISP